MSKTRSNKQTPEKKALPISSEQEDVVMAIVENKTIKAKEKVMLLSDLLLDKRIIIDKLVDTAKSQKDTVKATLIEAMEFASKSNPEIINEKAFKFSIRSLEDDALRVKWEAAKVIANTAHLFPKFLKKSVVNLLANTEHSGNVVRWSAATALSKIIHLNLPLNKELIPVAEAIIQREKDNAVKKIYQQALKKIKR